MGKSYCPGWSQTVAEGNFWAKTPAYLCGNQPVSQARHLGAAALWEAQTRTRSPRDTLDRVWRGTPHPDPNKPQIEAQVEL